MPPIASRPPRPPSDRAETAGEEVRVANRATYWPIAPIDLVVGGPLVARLIFGASPIGRVVQAAVVGAYLGSAFRDWRDRRAIRRIDFRGEFGADFGSLLPMPPDGRAAEVRRLAARLNEEFTAERLPRRALAVEVDRHLTSYIASITGQHVRTSVEVRGFTLARLAFPFALGACDVLSGDVAIFADTGFFEPHVIAHEFCHRKGYWKELHAQVLAYVALERSGHPMLVQAARLERLYRHLRVLAGDDANEFNRLVAGASLRPELEEALIESRPPANTSNPGEATMRALYDARMRLTGQNGLSDYDLGFTEFLYTFETSATARQKPRAAEARP